MDGQLVVNVGIGPSACLTLPATVLLADKASVWCSENRCVDDVVLDAWAQMSVEDRMIGPERLVYSRSIAMDRWTLPVQGCLAEFVRLADAPARRILTFAQSWGVLGICEHGLPGTHGTCPPLADMCHLTVEPKASVGYASVTCNRERRFQEFLECEPEARERLLVDDPSWYWEPVSAWRDFAHLFGALMRAAGRLTNNRLAATEDLGQIVQFRLHYTDRDQFHAREADLRAEFGRQCALVADMVDALLVWADLTPRMAWAIEGGPPMIGLNPGEGAFGASSSLLFPALVIRLAATLISPLGIFQCDECGAPYTPARRRPRSDRHQYCPMCSDDASLAAKRRWWHENRSPAARDRAPEWRA